MLRKLFSALVEIEQRQLCFWGWIQYISGIWRFSIPLPVPTTRPKSMVMFRIKKKKKKSSYQLQILQIWFFCQHWIKLKSVALEVQRAMQQIRPLWLCQVLRKWGYISLFSGSLPWACVFLPLQLESPGRNQPRSTEKCWSSAIWETKR